MDQNTSNRITFKTVSALAGFLVICAAIPIVVGCAPPSRKKKPDSPQAKHPAYLSKVFYVAEAQSGSEPQEVQERVSGTAQLNRTSGPSVLDAANPLVLPLTPPNEVSVEVVLNESDLKRSSAYVVRGEIMKGGALVRALPAAAFLVDDIASPSGQGTLIRIGFAIKELGTLIKSEESDALLVSLTLSEKSGSNKEVKKVSFELRNPPLQLTLTNYFPVSAFEKEKQVSIPDAFRIIYLPNGERLELLGIIELENGSDVGFGVRVPFTFIHEFFIVNQTKSVASYECGHRLNESTSKEKLDSSIRLIALGHDLGQVYAAGRSNGLYPIFLDGKAAVQLGVYSTLKDASSAPGGNLTRQSVPLRCMAHCTSGGEGDWADEGKWGGSCVACGRLPSSMGEACFGCMRSRPAWCRWQHWRSWKEYTEVSVGTAFQYELVPQDQGAFSEFELAYPYQQVSPRKLRILSNTVVIGQ